MVRQTYRKTDGIANVRADIQKDRHNNKCHSRHTKRRAE